MTELTWILDPTSGELVLEGLTVEVIVVSDGSTDATERVARDLGALVVGRDMRRGQGAAVSLLHGGRHRIEVSGPGATEPGTDTATRSSY